MYFYCATARNAMHGIAMSEISVHPSVCLSVRPSVKRMNCDKMKETSYAHIFIPHEKAFILVF